MTSHIYTHPLFLLLPSGFFGHTFTVPGVYYYSSGYIDNANVKTLQGVVKVVPREDKNNKVSVSVADMKAKHVAGGKCIEQNKMCIKHIQSVSFYKYEKVKIMLVLHENQWKCVWKCDIVIAEISEENNYVYYMYIVNEPLSIFGLTEDINIQLKI